MTGARPPLRVRLTIIAALVTAVGCRDMSTRGAQAAAPPPPPASAKVYPPWGRAPQHGHPFSVPDIDNVPDLYGDIVAPQLVLFLGGNQFMVVPDLIDAFRAAYPQYQRIFVETLPPGVLASQIQEGALILGNLRIDLKPDLYAAGLGRLDRMQQASHLFDTTVSYAENRLAIMVRADNPGHVQAVSDLGRDDVRVSMPNPAWEGIATQIEAMYRRAGGEPLDDRIMRRKVANGTTVLTQIHHRQTPIWIMQRKADAGPVWYTEAYFQRMIGNPIQLVEIPDSLNFHATYAAGVLHAAPHPAAARAFAAFLRGPQAQAVFRKYGFLPPPASR